MSTLTINKEQLKLLKQLYAKAVETHQKQFTFQGEILLTDYAKYLVQHLECSIKD